MSTALRSTARQQATEETRARVVRAARAAFAADGYAGASMRRIAADAGLTAMALYTYAPSKADLFQLVYEDGIGRIYAEYARVVTGCDTLVDEVDAVLVCGGELLTREPDLLRFTMRVAVDHQHDDLCGRSLLPAPYVAFFERLAARAVARGEIVAGDEARLVGFVTMLLWGITTTTSIEPSQVRTSVATARWAARGRLAR